MAQENRDPTPQHGAFPGQDAGKHTAGPQRLQSGRHTAPGPKMVTGVSVPRSITRGYAHQPGLMGTMAAWVLGWGRSESCSQGDARLSLRAPPRSLHCCPINPGQASPACRLHDTAQGHHLLGDSCMQSRAQKPWDREGPVQRQPHPRGTWHGERPLLSTDSQQSIKQTLAERGHQTVLFKARIGITTPIHLQFCRKLTA